MAGINPGAGAPAVPPAHVVEEVWKTTPFSGDFNPGSKPGNSIFIEQTKGLHESVRLDIYNTNNIIIIIATITGSAPVLNPLM